MQLTKAPPKRKGGQGTGHLKNPGAFSGAPAGAPPASGNKRAPTGHPKRGGKHNVKGK